MAHKVMMGRGNHGLPPKQLEALKRHSPDANTILNNLDAYSDEVIVDSGDRLDRFFGLGPTAQNMPARELKPVQEATPILEEAEEELEEEEEEMEDELDTLLDDYEAEMQTVAEPDSAPLLSEAEKMQNLVRKALADHKDAPSKAQIASWKKTLGENNVHLIAFDEDYVFVFSHLKRGQWKKVQKLMMELSQRENARSLDMEETLKVKVCKSAILWPAVSEEYFDNAPAGLLDAVYMAISQHSYFLAQEQVSVLTVQL